MSTRDLMALLEAILPSLSDDERGDIAAHSMRLGAHAARRIEHRDLEAARAARDPRTEAP